MLLLTEKDLKIRLTPEGSAEVLSDLIRVEDRKERVVLVAERSISIGRQEIQIYDQHGSSSSRSRQSEATDGRMEGHCEWKRQVGVAEKEGLLLSGCAQEENWDVNKHESYGASGCGHAKGKEVAISSTSTSY